jgi:hypothetical protein
MPARQVNIVAERQCNSKSAFKHFAALTRLQSSEEILVWGPRNELALFLQSVKASTRKLGKFRN